MPFVIEQAGKICVAVDRDKLNRCNASRKRDRETIARALIELARARGAQCERRDEGRNLGYHGASIHLVFTLNGVGAMLNIDDLHGGDWALVSWFNTDYPARNFNERFARIVGDQAGRRPYHKATSHPADWYSLAMFLDGGLCLAARGGAFHNTATSH